MNTEWNLPASAGERFKHTRGTEIDDSLLLYDEQFPLLFSNCIEIVSYFKCYRCGKCCTHDSPVIFVDEFDALSKNTGRRFFDALDPSVFPHRFKTPCPFYKNICEIQTYKPDTCKIYPFSMSQIDHLLLYLCPMGRKILNEYITFFKSNYGCDLKHQLEPNKAQTEQVEREQGTLSLYATIPYQPIPLFLKYLSQTKEKTQHPHDRSGGVVL
jgi:Fe-S-cluster containining protein